MIARDITNELISLSRQYPVVTVTGPRQAGKTTLARAVFANYNYVNLELPDIRGLALEDANAFFDRFKCPLIIDEIQRVPSLLSYIQVRVDQANDPGQFILTGSNQLELTESITQSLAGRTAILKLLPFSIRELGNAGVVHSAGEFISKGFLPRIYDKMLEHFKAYGNYLETYVERDVRRQANIRNLNQFEAFLKLLAGRVGQVVNLHSLSNEVGVTSATLSEWLSILEASYIIFRIHPYFENFGKRVIKSPKVYFTEVGLASYLLGIQTADQAVRDPLYGGLFENLVASEILKTRYNAGLPLNLYYFRDSNGNEVDFLFEERRQLVPVEVKSAMTFNHKMSKTIKYFQQLTDKATKGYIFYSGELEFDKSDYSVLNFTKANTVFGTDAQRS